MTLKKSTCYALYASLEMARAGKGVPVTVSRVAARYEIPVAVLAKVFQQLVRGGVAVGTRGTGGGYSLSRSPSELTVLDVIRVFESVPQAAQHQGPLRKLFEEVDEQVRCTYASVTLETLAGNRPEEEARFHVVQ